jgi:hypothetical protein
LAGTIIVSDIKTDTDNSFVVRANTGNVLFRVTDTGLDTANSIASGSITSDMIADGTVIAADVADGSITTAKIADGNVTVDKIASGSITTAKIADGNVTSAKIDTVANTQVTGTMTTAQVADEAITQAKIASGVAGTGPAFSAYAGSGNVSISTNTWTKVALNSEEFDTNNDFDSTTNYRFTPTIAGYYQINGLIGTENSGATTRTLAMIRKNGGEFKFGDDLSGNTHTGSNVGVNALIYMNGSTDYLELWIYMTGTSTHYNGTLQRTYFQGYLVRAA